MPITTQEALSRLKSTKQKGVSAQAAVHLNRAWDSPLAQSRGWRTFGQRMFGWQVSGG